MAQSGSFSPRSGSAYVDDPTDEDVIYVVLEFQAISAKLSPEGNCMRNVILGVLVVASMSMVSCNKRSDVQCSSSGDCDLSAGGECLTATTGNMWCAYPDPSCPGGYQYSTQDVGDGLGGTCVPY